MIMMKSPEKKTVRSSEPDSKQNLHNLGADWRREEEGEEEEEEMMMMKLPEKETH
jgi:hypothetical protein